MKRISKYLAVIMTVAMLLSLTFSMSSAKTVSGYETGDIVYYGTYPSSLVEDENLLKDLEANKKKCDKNGDLDYFGLRFRRVYFKTHRDDGTENNTNFQKANGYEAREVYWFRYEPIAWRVLSEENGQVLLMSEYAIDAQPYNTDEAPITWKDSSIREWLNGEFKDTAFTDKQQEEIRTSANVNNDNPIYGSYNGKPSPFAGNVNSEGYPFKGTEGGENTIDLVFLASFDEITNKDYGFNLDWTEVDDFGRFAGYYDEDPARMTSGTDYALSQGVWSNLELDTDNCRYWLRTPGYNSTYAAGVLDDGRVSTGWEVDYTILGVRPLIRLDSDAEQTSLTIGVEDNELRYREKDVRLLANMDVKWSSSNPEIATIDDNGYITVLDVGKVTFYATSVDNPSMVATCEIEISYEWWQWLIRIFLFGWIWY